MSPDINFNCWAIGISLAVFLSSYVLICRADRSWLNWATPTYLTMTGANFLFPFMGLVLLGSAGSHYAYTYCYATYALSSLCNAIAYALTRRARQSAETSHEVAEMGYIPWMLLAFGALLYAPIMVKFSGLLLHPREIYIQTRSGFGPLMFGSTALVNLAFIVYLFKKKNKLGAIIFFFICFLILFLHGSKGLLVNLASMWMLYAVYVKRRRVGILKASAVMCSFAVLVMCVFAVFANLTDVVELFSYMQGYSDYTKNAMMVIDNPIQKIYGGTLTAESEFYSRIPRVLYPAKPKDFGMFRLAEYYYPTWFELDTGSPDFGIGMQYADFGPWAIVLICATSTMTGVMTGWIVRKLNDSPSPPKLILLLFFSGTAIISFGAGYALPESTFLAMCLASLIKLRRVRFLYDRLILTSGSEDSHETARL